MRGNAFLRTCNFCTFPSLLYHILTHAFDFGRSSTYPREIPFVLLRVYDNQNISFFPLVMASNGSYGSGFDNTSLQIILGYDIHHSHLLSHKIIYVTHHTRVQVTRIALRYSAFAPGRLCFVYRLPW
jgi:hypothetical protein